MRPYIANTSCIATWDAREGMFRIVRQKGKIVEIMGMFAFIHQQMEGTYTY